MCFIQDEDADFMAKLAKLMSAAGTQLLNSYSKYDSIIFYFFCPIFPQAVSCPCKVKFTFLFSHLFATLFCLGNISLLFFLDDCYIQFLVFTETVVLRWGESENKNWVLSNELIKVELPL